MIFSFKKSLFIHLITWSVFKKYMDLAGFFDRGAHSELNVVKQLGTLELNRLWAHVPKGGKPSPPASTASTDKLQFCWCHHSGCLSKSHTLLLLVSQVSSLDVKFLLRSELPLLATHHVSCIARHFMCV